MSRPTYARIRPGLALSIALPSGEVVRIAVEPDARGGEYPGRRGGLRLAVKCARSAVVTVEGRGEMPPGGTSGDRPGNRPGLDPGRPDGDGRTDRSPGAGGAVAGLVGVPGVGYRPTPRLAPMLRRTGR